MFKLNKLMFLTLKASFIIIITSLTINYKCYKTVIITVTIIIYKLSLLIVVLNKYINV